MSIINKNQGAVKQSEIAVDEALSTIQTSSQEDALTVVKQLQALVADSINKNSYLLMSEGQVSWDGTNIGFEVAGDLADITVKMIQNQIDADAFSIDLNLVAGLANTSNTFNTIILNDNEVLYIEIDRPELLSSGGSIDLENEVGGSSGLPHFTVKKALFTSGAGLPKITSSIDGTVTPSLYIPLAYAKTYTVGATTFKDIWWIPHGIRWPENTTSTLGAVIVEGVETYPNKFVSSLTDLQTAASDLSSAGGGVILITDNFSVDSNVSIPKNVTLMSRGDKVLSFTSGGRFTCQSGVTIKNFKIATTTIFNNSAIILNGNRAVVSNIEFDFTNHFDGASTNAVNISGDFNRVERCSFTGLLATTNSVGVNYTATADSSYDIDSEWL